MILLLVYFLPCVRCFDIGPGGGDEKSDLLGDREDHLIPSASQGESTVFFNKMKGDVTITAILKNSNQDSGDEGKEAVFSFKSL